MKNNRIPEGTLLWKPDEKVIGSANLNRYMNWLRDRHGLDFKGYDELWKWSVEQAGDFWESIATYFDVRFVSPYSYVLGDGRMPYAEWFPGATLNFAEYAFDQKNDHPALIFKSETAPLTEISWDELYRDAAAFAIFLKRSGVGKGDRVAAYIPNIPQAFSCMLATASIGAVWSACSPDFGSESVIERFSQIGPRVFVTVDGYNYGGKKHDRLGRVEHILKSLPSVENIVLIPYLNADCKADCLNTETPVILWDELFVNEIPLLHFEPVPFDHPLWILYSSGTTGLPKPIVHGHGGILLEHLKYMELHADVKPGDRFFWYSTTGWMMWNVVLSALLRGATALVYDGSPAWPDMDALWRFAEETRMTCFGTSATYITGCMKQNLKPKEKFDLGSLRSVGSTGSPLPPEGFNWVYENVGSHTHLNSTSGGTDICSSFVGGNPLLPVYAGEIQCRLLGCSVESYNEDGKPVINEVGEMVITKPMPSMPVFFWGDEGNQRYIGSYFEMFPGIWRHGDWLKVTDRGTCVIYGRSDATLNKMGVRIGTSEIYRAVESDPDISDSLIVSLELDDGSWYMPLFVKLKEGIQLSDDLKSRIAHQIRERISPRFVPDEIIPIHEIPYTLSGKKMEKPVKSILSGTQVTKAASPDSMKNPAILDFFVEFASSKFGKHGE